MALINRVLIKEIKSASSDFSSVDMLNRFALLREAIVKSKFYTKLCLFVFKLIYKLQLNLLGPKIDRHHK